MKKSIQLILLIYCICGFKTTDAQITFNITTSFGVDVMNNIILSDSGYYSAVTSGQPILPRHSILCFYDTLGNLKWNRVYGETNELFNDYSMYQDKDRNFTMGSAYLNFNLKKYKLSLRRVTNSGDSIWLKSYGPDTSKNYYGAWVLKTLDSGYLISAQVANTTDGNIYVLKTDSAGNFEWDYELLGNGYDQAYDAAETANHDYLIVGWTRSFGNGNLSFRDAIVVCIDSLGQYKWKKTFGVSTLSEGFYHIIPTIDGNFIMVGGQGDQTTFANGRLWKIDSSGNLLWQHYYPTYSNASVFYGVHELPNGNIVVVGTDQDSTVSFDQAWFLIMDSLGNKISDRRFSIGNYYSIFNDFKQTKDKGFIIAGYVLGGPNGEDGWLVKLDSNACDIAGCATIYTGLNEIIPFSKTEIVTLFPNPCTSTLFIKPEFGYSVYSATVFDLTGKEIASPFYKNKETLQITTEHLNPGIYLVRLLTDVGFKTVKFVKH